MFLPMLFRACSHRHCALLRADPVSDGSETSLGKNLWSRRPRQGEDEYDLMGREAEKSPVGARKLLFNPSLGGGMPMDKSYNLRGAYIGLDLLPYKGGCYPGDHGRHIHEPPDLPG